MVRARAVGVAQAEARAVLNLVVQVVLNLVVKVGLARVRVEARPGWLEDWLGRLAVSSTASVTL